MSPIPEEPGLFDLPLVPTGAPPGPAPEELEGGEDLPEAPRREAPRGEAGRRRPARPAAPESLSLFADDEAEETSGTPPARRAVAGEAAAERRPRPVPASAVTAPAAGSTAGVAPRLRAATGDVVVLAAVGALAALGARTLGATIGVAALVPLAVFLAAFSFLYSVISLAFWGQTPGMAWAGLVARTPEGEPLSFGQTALRWAGAWLTWATLGVAGLLALTGRSLADRVSGSSTYEVPELSDPLPAS